MLKFQTLADSFRPWVAAWLREGLSIKEIISELDDCYWEGFAIVFPDDSRVEINEAMLRNF